MYHPSTSSSQKKRPSTSPIDNEASSSKRPKEMKTTFNKFRVSANDHFDIAYKVVMLLETLNSALNFTARPNLKSQFILTPQDQATYEFLKTFNTLEGHPVNIVELDHNARETKAVVMKYPIYMDTAHLLKHPNVLTAKRCVMGDRKTATRSVLVTFEGPAPKQVVLKTWGSFPIRPYNPEPPRCYKCNKFGHLRGSCSGPAICGVCSGRHETEQCITALKQNKKIKAKCPNCSQGHHAWNLSCPERVKRVHGSRTDTRNSSKNMPPQPKSVKDQTPRPKPERKQQQKTSASASASAPVSAPPAKKTSASASAPVSAPPAKKMSASASAPVSAPPAKKMSASASASAPVSAPPAKKTSASAPVSVPASTPAPPVTPTPVVVPQKPAKDQKPSVSTAATSSKKTTRAPTPPPEELTIPISQMQTLMMHFITVYSALMQLECDPRTATQAFNTALHMLNEDDLSSSDEEDIDMDEFDH